MNGLSTVSFEALAECIALASGDPDAFLKLWLERNGNSDITEITDKGKPCFRIQTGVFSSKLYPSKISQLNETDVWLDAYATELDLKM